MKQMLIWFNLQKDGTGNGLPITSRILLQYVCSYKCQFFKPGLSSSYDGWTKYKEKVPDVSSSGIHLNSQHHSHNKQKDGLETQVIFADISTWTWNIWKDQEEDIKTAKNGSFFEELLCENDSEAVLVNFCCYGFGANASEAVQKISTGTLELHANSLKRLIL